MAGRTGHARISAFSRCPRPEEAEASRFTRPGARPLTTARKITLTDTCEVFVGYEAEAPAHPSRRALLIFCDGEAQLQALSPDAAVVIGRAAPSEVIIDDNSVSRQHARFVLSGDDVIVEDLDSRNGTFVAGQRIREQRLKPGDEVQVGRARVVLAATGATAGPETANAVSSEGDFIIRNARMKELYEHAHLAARASVPVLVLGETGSGKEHVANTLHLQGPRRDGPFVAVNCAAIPAGLVESTLFGHERGAFTGAASRGVGVFERANHGVLFLDEVGELNPNAQAALLRALETQRICRIGATTEIAVDVRVVAATHCDLAAMIEKGAFRQDLYFRLSGVVLEVPPLRERPDEIEPMVSLFLSNASREWNRPRRDLTAEAMQAITRYAWPGNVRQLRQALERAALLGVGDAIAEADLPEYVLQGVRTPEAAVTVPSSLTELALDQQLLRHETALIEEALRRAGGSRQTAAKLLRIPLRTLYRRMRACGIGTERRAGSTSGSGEFEAS
jgi:two-component system, NtrC family, response regulator AtoC